jgi:hypothetical protein
MISTVAGLHANQFIHIFDTNPHSMGKSILKAFVMAALMGLLLSSCEALEDCKTCALVTKDNGVETFRGPGILYCGDNLAEKENYSETIGSLYTYYDCK